MIEEVSVADANGVVWTATAESLESEFNQRLGLVVAYATIDGEMVISNFSLEAWKRGGAVMGADISRPADSRPKQLTIPEASDKRFYLVFCETRGREVYRVKAFSPEEALSAVQNGDPGDPVHSEVYDMEAEYAEIDVDQ